LLYYIKTGVIKGIRKRFALWLLREVDLFVSIGKMEDQILKEIISNAKSIVAYPFVREEMRKKLIKIKPNLNSHKILTIGTNSAYYKGIDIIFLSCHEGFGLSILEAQARGLLVMIYKYGKKPKEVRRYCFEAESPEHMAWIIMQLKENGYNEKLKKKATEYARSFTWEKTARETLEVYKKVLGE
jgi:glycosyltransferase involved in cell wall biosynthesis